MGLTFEQGRQKVVQLVRDFAMNRAAFLASGVKEAHVRQNLIDPLFEALGWDVPNRQQVAPPYREVVPEDSVDAEGQQKAPDYTFRVGPLAKFFAEAKTCGIRITTDPAPSYQLRRYGWSAKVGLSVLTNFEHFGSYDCTVRPRPSDKATHALIGTFLHYEEYPDRWRELWDVYSRQAVWSGAHDHYAASKRKRGTSEVDQEFLKEIEGWRESLASNIAARNKDVGPDDLNRAVQLTIDRIVFLRMAEDRGLEPYDQLLKLCERPDIYKRFMALRCQPADEKYNSGLFHFQKEPGIEEPPDTLTPRLKIDDRVLKSILQGLYFVHGSPYHFGILPVEILGTVYERFLGKFIRLTSGHQARVEEKLEVRKAGGIYYTPAHVVRYIVKETVGKLIEGRAPARLAGGKGRAAFRVLDMACGTGSFLLGAYQCILDHCLRWYLEHAPEQHKAAVYREPRKGEWRLTIEEKKRLLTTHVFGVDIDPQAIEVSKLSLLLKALEGENETTLATQLQLRLFHDRALPNLAANLRRGNSLIGPDYFMETTIAEQDQAGELKRVNPFDWDREFPQAMAAGGFDCVIGNPPYGGLLSAADKVYLQNHYSCQNYQLDTYLLFLEAAVRRTLRRDGRFGMIVPNPWLTNLQQTKARRLVFGETCVETIVHFLRPVFPKVTVDTEVVVLRKSDPGGWKPLVLIVPSAEDLEVEASFRRVHHDQDRWRALDGGVVNIFLTDAARRLVEKCKKRSRPLSALCKINVGIKPYQAGKGTPPQTPQDVADRPFDSDRPLTALHRQYLRGKDIQRYLIAPREPRYLKYGPWIAEPRPAAEFDAVPKLLMRQTGDRLVTALDENQLLCLNNMHVIVPNSDVPSPLYLLGILNSKLLNWYYQTINPEKGEALAEVKRANVAALPIHGPRPDETGASDLDQDIVQRVKEMLSLARRHTEAWDRSAAQGELIRRQMDATDAQIDRLVYELYGLHPREIALVEASEAEA
jgi:type I restriction-modification system DNA methylase subunit